MAATTVQGIRRTHGERSRRNACGMSCFKQVKGVCRRRSRWPISSPNEEDPYRFKGCSRRVSVISTFSLAEKFGERRSQKGISEEGDRSVQKHDGEGAHYIWDRLEKRVMYAEMGFGVLQSEGAGERAGWLQIIESWRCTPWLVGKRRGVLLQTMKQMAQKRCARWPREFLIETVRL